MTSRPPICAYVPSADGGHPLYARQLLHALVGADSDFDFELVSATDLASVYDTDAYTIHRLVPPLKERSAFPNRLTWAADRVGYYPRRERAFLEWLERRPDIAAVHLHEWQFWLMPWLVRRIVRSGKRVFATIHNVYPHRYPTGVPKSVVDGMVRRGCMQCAGLFVHTQRLADELAKFLGAGAPPIFVMPHGAWDVADKPGRPTLAERIASKRLLFFGVLRRNKGLHVLLRAIELLPEFSLTIAGQPQDPEYYERECLPLIRDLQAKGRRIQVRADYIGDAEAADLFATHGAVMLPYTGEFMAQSGVIFMAIAHGVPVVATGAGGLRELLDAFPIGTVCDAAEPEALAATTRALFERTDVEQLRANLEAARRHHSWANAAEATLKGYAVMARTAEVHA
jgi:glycosyltransferase involved in cell wall biosynthesis